MTRALAVALCALAAAAPALAVEVGATVLLAPRTQDAGCTRGVLPDRDCSPGAYYSKLTRRVICSASFRTGDVRDVSASERAAVLVEYGLPVRKYGRALEVDHIVPLELGGSNAIANLFPESRDGARGYAAKDRLENAAHDLVCEGSLGLRAAQRAMAANWIAFYRRVFGATP